MAQNLPAIPLVSQLQDKHTWVQVCPPASCPTSVAGDWKSFPHLCNKTQWKDKMGSRASAFDAYLQAKINIWIDRCDVCAKAGRGMRADFGGHVGAPFHYKELGNLLPDGGRLDSIRQTLWQSYNIPGGAIRFNHADGCIELCSGQPPADGAGYAPAASKMVPHQAVPSVPIAGSPSAAPVASNELHVLGVPSPSASPTKQSPAGLSAADGFQAVKRYVPEIGKEAVAVPYAPEQLPESGVWFELLPQASFSTKANGDWNCYPHLASKSIFKGPMTKAAELVSMILERQPTPIWPECKVCDRSRGYAEHLGADKHYRMLWDKFYRNGAPLEETRKEAWQHWLIVGGELRINELDGAVQMLRSAGWQSCSSTARAAPTSEHEAPSRATSSYSAEPQAEPVAEGDDGTTQLGCFLWRMQFEKTVEQLEAKLLAAGVRHEDLACQICNGRSMFGRVGPHLLTPDHFRRLAAAASNALPRPLSSYSALPTEIKVLEQEFQVPGGRVTLKHFPPEVVVETAVAQQDRGKQPCNQEGAAQPIEDQAWCRRPWGGGFIWVLGQEWFAEGDPPWERAEWQGDHYWIDTSKSLESPRWFWESSGRTTK